MLRYLSDTGAGRSICSEQALVKQGVPRDLIQAWTGKASIPMRFETGGGVQNVYKSINMISDLVGDSEEYMMPKESPFAVCADTLVNQRRQPFVWLPGASESTASFITERLL